MTPAVLTVPAPFTDRVEVHEELGSTIDRCRALAESGAPAGTAVIALRQTAGRGQPGHSWSTPEGGLAISVLLRPELTPEDSAILAPLTGLAACEALRSLGVPCRLKQPNDLLAVRGGRWRKLGGMLVDTAIQGERLRHAILSLGVNVAVPLESLDAPLRGIAVSCHEIASPPPGLSQVAGAFLNEVAALAPRAEGTPEERRDLLGRHAAHVRSVVPGAACRPGDD